MELRGIDLAALDHSTICTGDSGRYVESQSQSYKETMALYVHNQPPPTPTASTLVC